MPEKTICEKLLLKPGRSLCVVNAPEGFIEALEPLPTFARLVNQTANADVLLLFTHSQSELNQEIEKRLPTLKESTIFWVSYPKKNRNGVSELDREYLKVFLNRANWQGSKMVSLNENWVAVMVKRK